MSQSIYYKSPINLMYLALTDYELGYYDRAKDIMRECMIDPELNGEKNEQCMILWVTLMCNEG